MKEIKLSQGKVALVNDEDYDFLMQWKWYVSSEKGRFYAVRKEKEKKIRMHRVIMNAPKEMDVDHADRNGLNCQRINLRICSRSQNLMNKVSRSNTGYKGVTFFIKKYRIGNKVYTYNKYKMSIAANGFRFGTDYNDKIEAALAYNEAAKKYHGEFAVLNSPPIVRFYQKPMLIPVL